MTEKETSWSSHTEWFKVASVPTPSTFLFLDMQYSMLSCIYFLNFRKTNICANKMFPSSEEQEVENCCYEEFWFEDLKRCIE